MAVDGPANVGASEAIPPASSGASTPLHDEPSITASSVVPKSPLPQVESDLLAAYEEHSAGHGLETDVHLGVQNVFGMDNPLSETYMAPIYLQERFFPSVLHYAYYQILSRAMRTCRFATDFVRTWREKVLTCPDIKTLAKVYKSLTGHMVKKDGMTYAQINQDMAILLKVAFEARVAQYPDIAEQLLRTGENVIVSCNPLDRLRSLGYAWPEVVAYLDNKQCTAETLLEATYAPASADPNAAEGIFGKNLVGRTLMDIRTDMVNAGAEYFTDQCIFGEPAENETMEYAQTIMTNEGVVIEGIEPFFKESSFNDFHPSPFSMDDREYSCVMEFHTSMLLRHFKLYSDKFANIPEPHRFFREASAIIHKALKCGFIRQVDVDVWKDAQLLPALIRVYRKKITESEELQNELLGTGNKLLVFTNIHSKGVGVAMSTDDVHEYLANEALSETDLLSFFLHPERRPLECGRNFLGVALMVIREELKAEIRKRIESSRQVLQNQMAVQQQWNDFVTARQDKGDDDGHLRDGVSDITSSESSSDNDDGSSSSDENEEPRQRTPRVSDQEEEPSQEDSGVQIINEQQAPSCSFWVPIPEVVPVPDSPDPDVQIVEDPVEEPQAQPQDAKSEQTDEPASKADSAIILDRFKAIDVESLPQSTEGEQSQNIVTVDRKTRKIMIVRKSDVNRSTPDPLQQPEGTGNGDGSTVVSELEEGEEESEKQSDTGDDVIIESEVNSIASSSMLAATNGDRPQPVIDRSARKIVFLRHAPRVLGIEDEQDGQEQENDSTRRTGGRRNRQQRRSRLDPDVQVVTTKAGVKSRSERSRVGAPLPESAHASPAYATGAAADNNGESSSVTEIIEISEGVSESPEKGTKKSAATEKPKDAPSSGPDATINRNLSALERLKALNFASGNAGKKGRAVLARKSLANAEKSASEGSASTSIAEWRKLQNKRKVEEIRSGGKRAKLAKIDISKDSLGLMTGRELQNAIAALLKQ